MRMSWFGAVIVVAGCAAGPEPGSGAPQALGPDPGTGAGAGYFDEEPNGRWVLGAVLDAPPYTPLGASEYFSVGTAGAARRGLAQKVTFEGGGSLRSSGPDGTFAGTDKHFDGLTFSEGPWRVTLTVVGGDADLTHYALDLQEGSTPPVRVCDDAIVLTGVVERSGRHVATPGRLSFACAGGGAHKCAVWGYAPGTRRGPLWGVHQGCLQMVTANYCADGAASTRTGTSIAFYDDVGVYQIPAGAQLPAITPAAWPPAPDDWYFEAAFVDRHAEALCVAKLRWPTLTDGCVQALPECPDGSVDPLIDPHGAVLFVASRYNQLRLDRWQKRVDGLIVDRVATVRGYHNAADQATKVPWDGYEHAGRDGVLLRVPPASVDPKELVEVAVFRRLGSGDHFVARRDDARFTSALLFADEGFEGWVFRTQSPGQERVPLALFRRADTGERLATTMDAAAMAALGYVSDPDASGSTIIGWIAPAP
jgi:hypothetical protein